MRTKLTVACALAAFVAVAGGTAEATGLVHTSGIAKGAVTFNRLSPGVQKMVAAKAVPASTGAVGATGAVGLTGSTGATGLTGLLGPKGATGSEGPQGVAGGDGVPGLQGLKGDAGAAGAPGTNGTNGVNGLPGAKGDTGATGLNGAPGAAGNKGDTGEVGQKGSNGLPGVPGAPGAPGADGHDGTNGVNAPAAQYGVATVNVARGTGAATAWATYSDSLGSPVGDTFGGSFRFTCTDDHVTCTITVKAAVLGSSGHAVYPRVLVYSSRPVGDGGPETYCEYGDGGATAVTAQAPSAKPAYTALGLHVGGTTDCGIVGPAGDAGQIVVPAGYYDVQSTFLFLP